jgi:hypothetical protein
MQTGKVEKYENWFTINDRLLESELEAIKQLLPPIKAQSRRFAHMGRSPAFLL